MPPSKQLSNPKSGSSFIFPSPLTQGPDSSPHSHLLVSVFAFQTLVLACHPLCPRELQSPSSSCLPTLYTRFHSNPCSHRSLRDLHIAYTESCPVIQCHPLIFKCIKLCAVPESLHARSPGWPPTPQLPSFPVTLFSLNPKSLYLAPPAYQASILRDFASFLASASEVMLQPLHEYKHTFLAQLF